MLHRVFAFTLAVPFLVLVASCSSSGGVPRTSSPCTDLYSGYAIWSQTCLGTVPDRRALDSLAVRCAARAALPGIEATDTMLWDCADAVAASSCTALPISCLTRLSEYSANPREIWLAPDSDSRYELFPRVRQGILPVGTPCAMARQCQSGHCSSDASCGVCFEVRAFGEACDETTGCEFGSTCTDGTCVEQGDGIGAACSVPAKGDSGCKPSLRCLSGVCTSRGAIGDSCQSNESCSRAARCVDGSCKAMTTAQAGEDCDEAATCEDGTICADGQCRGPITDVGKGLSCSIDICAAGLACKYDVCEPAAGAGQACSYLIACTKGLFCDALATERCLPLRLEGEPCGEFARCVPGFSCYGAPENRCHRGEGPNAPCSTSAECSMELACRNGACAAFDPCPTSP